MKKKPHLKPEFLEKMKLIFKDEKEFKKYIKSLNTSPLKSIRCNTLKIAPKELIKRLKQKNWKINQPFSEYPELIVIESKLKPGELGKTIEHILGYYYVQDIASFLPVLSLNIKPNEKVIDLAAAPGSKTSQIASKMQNKGLLFANDISLGRIKILSANLERCGVTNEIITKQNAIVLSKKLKNLNYKFNKILLDAPCSGEGTLNSNYKTGFMLNEKTIKKLSFLQKDLIIKAIELLEENGELVYSTCTHAPEENEEVINFVLEKFKDNIVLEKPIIPKEIKTKNGITNWKEKTYNSEVKKCIRIYPQDNKTEGFFVAKIKKIK